MSTIPEPEQILKYFLVPDNTRVEANRITVKGDVIVGNHSNIGYSIFGDTVIMGEGVTVTGDIAASSDIRVDMWSKLGSKVEVGRNAYLGEFVTIDGKLFVEGDLDVGKEVKIRGGFEEEICHFEQMVGSCNYKKLKMRLVKFYEEKFNPNLPPITKAAVFLYHNHKVRLF